MIRMLSALLVTGAVAAVVPVALNPLARPALAAGLIPEVGGGAVPSLAPMLSRITPGVVNIAVRGRVKEQNPLAAGSVFPPLLQPAAEPPQERETQATGSGVIVDAAQGYVLTNGHVVENATRIEVTTKDNRRLAAKLIGRDADTDIAVLRIPAGNLTAVPMGDSDHLQVGDFVLAIGNPFGLGQTVTSGIVSALGRSGLGIEGYEDFIQTDASINPGNSGGPLVNLRGECVGINTAILAPGGGNIGIGFAVPINMARKVMEQLISLWRSEARPHRRGDPGSDPGSRAGDEHRAHHRRGHCPRRSLLARRAGRSAHRRSGCRGQWRRGAKAGPSCAT